MKKLMLAAVALGLVTISCGTKESSMSTGSTDSTAAVDNTMQSTPATTDSMTTNSNMSSPDSMKMGTDSSATATPAR
ncbi:cytochrome C551 [Chryseobacterium sp. JJR-5R]|uniref:cytochrome C551 n=1 Tax=Chryseobacterium sp. JJR-5R TaxID=3093923 RepID=UPI002A75C304|nr:cytochrome C551 [Chryseobacterium sp. JJR-5R]WPO81702.1 cytochrome C551 [Chryseobacterium sp. JJR-5R]